ncbi:hypothetical protein GCM10022248_09680 [Nonomuraea soli]
MTGGWPPMAEWDPNPRPQAPNTDVKVRYGLATLSTPRQWPTNHPPPGANQSPPRARPSWVCPGAARAEEGVRAERAPSGWAAGG